MAHFAFLTCNPLTLNAKKSSFFQYFLYTFLKTAFLTKVGFRFPILLVHNDHKISSLKHH